LLEVAGLTVRLGGKTVLDGIGFELEAGDRLGLIGASGSGKSLTALAILRLLPEGAEVSGSVRFDGTELLHRSDREMSWIRGGQIAMVFQEPRSALNPLMRVGRQIAEPLRLHRGLSRKHALAEAISLAKQVGLPDPEHLMRAYPHQLSGGQCQRVGIAMALASHPALLLADEPTTALDVTVQAEILALLEDLVAEQGTSLLFVTHDLAVLAQVVRQVVVLGEGRILEHGSLDRILHAPEHPATRTMVSVARSTAFRSAATSDTLGGGSR
jgi:ABC-type dipeptide/oligopeptide/nickel transport system ATPase component